MREIVRRDHQSRAICFESFIKLIKDFKKVNFIIKLHPSEDHQFYQKSISEKLSVSDRERVRIIVQEYIWDILNASDLELKRSCTTGIGSWILGKPTIEMKLNPNEWYYSEEHASGSDIAESYDSLANIIKYYLGGGEIKKEQQKTRMHFIKKWCYRVDGKATHRMVEHLNSLLNKKGKKNRKKINQTIKNRIIYYCLQIGDHWLHDAKVYGLKNLLQNGYIDKFGEKINTLIKKTFINGN